LNKERMRKVFNYIDSQKDRYISELSKLLSLPSLSIEGTGMPEGAQAVARLVESSGFKATINRQEKGFPIVTGFTGKTHGFRIGIYGHYDVFPSGDLSAWTSHPFKPEVRDGKLFARGATDDKGNLFANVKAAEAVKSVLGSVPVDVLFLFEGEEEIGSRSLEGFLRKNRRALGDVTAFIACDRGWHETGRPQIFLGCKSNLTVKLTVRGSTRDIHSGHSPLIPNPAWKLVHLLSKITGKDGKVLVPPLSKEKRKVSKKDLSLLKNIPFDVRAYKKSYGLKNILAKENAFDALKKLTFDATWNISNFVAGTVEANCIVPASATATIDLRASGDYNPYKIMNSLTQYIKKAGDIEITSVLTHGYRVPVTDPFVKKVVSIARMAFGLAPVVWPQWDGAGPLGILHRAFNVPAMIIGLGAPFSMAHTHANNEFIRLEDITNGIKLMASIFMNISE
jgi:acetylornithine deacetylase/succinyl-diaminopimelate desuccinylase-like protein